MTAEPGATIMARHPSPVAHVPRGMRKARLDLVETVTPVRLRHVPAHAATTLRQASRGLHARICEIHGEPGLWTPLDREGRDGRTVTVQAIGFEAFLRNDPADLSDRDWDFLLQAFARTPLVAAVEGGVVGAEAPRLFRNWSVPAERPLDKVGADRREATPGELAAFLDAKVRVVGDRVYKRFEPVVHATHSPSGIRGGDAWVLSGGHPDARAWGFADSPPALPLDGAVACLHAWDEAARDSGVRYEDGVAELVRMGRDPGMPPLADVVDIANRLPRHVVLRLRHLDPRFPGAAATLDAAFRDRLGDLALRGMTGAVQGSDAVEAVVAIGAGLSRYAREARKGAAEDFRLLGDYVARVVTPRLDRPAEIDPEDGEALGALLSPGPAAPAAPAPPAAPPAPARAEPIRALRPAVLACVPAPVAGFPPRMRKPRLDLAEVRTQVRLLHRPAEALFPVLGQDGDSPVLVSEIDGEDGLWGRLDLIDYNGAGTCITPDQFERFLMNERRGVPSANWECMTRAFARTPIVAAVAQGDPGEAPALLFRNFSVGHGQDFARVHADRRRAAPGDLDAFLRAKVRVVGGRVYRRFEPVLRATRGADEEGGTEWTISTGPPDARSWDFAVGAPPLPLEGAEACLRGWDGFGEGAGIVWDDAADSLSRIRSRFGLGSLADVADLANRLPDYVERRIERLDARFPGAAETMDRDFRRHLAELALRGMTGAIREAEAGAALLDVGARISRYADAVPGSAATDLKALGSYVGRVIAPRLGRAAESAPEDEAALGGLAP